MSNLKKALLLGVLGATAAASLAGYFLLGGPPTRLAVDGALALVQLVVVIVMLSPTEKRVDLLVDALRALARGERHRRVNPDEFAGLGEVARAMNEVAASLTENDDPNLGPVKSVPRKKDGATTPKPAVAPRNDDDDPSVGQVRRIKRDEPEARAKSDEPEARAKSEAASPAPGGASAAGKVAHQETPKAGAGASEGVASEPRPSARPPGGERLSFDAARPESAATTNDTSIDELKGSDASGSSLGDGEPVFPSRAELEKLFSDFVAQKKAHDESISDLDLDAFAQTILGECERLVSAHSCRGVRFEITEQGGEVSLRPRLLR